MSEVERFDAYYGYPSCRATGRHIHANGEFVLASDYDTLAAEIEAVKDELARVKAESLRVVKLPGTTEHECRIATMGIIDDVIGFKDVDADWYATPDWEPYTPEAFDKPFTPVRLERWENSNEAD